MLRLIEYVLIAVGECDVGRYFGLDGMGGLMGLVILGSSVYYIVRRAVFKANNREDVSLIAGF